MQISGHIHELSESHQARDFEFSQVMLSHINIIKAQGSGIPPLKAGSTGPQGDSLVHYCYNGHETWN